ncbi:MAG: 16S rRNA (cytidine(1402)-2'-O)-methyltransferase [Acidimicrobiales bacterium]|nr:16S rRNA (cytidine(1402)-2'-O)-methyltransferase [Acidimicrobiales bacterium]
MSGTLVLVATPIGNLGDLSPRAVEALEGAALICCEDTRRSGRLLAHAGVEGARLRRVDDYTEAAAVDAVVELLAAGEDVVLVSDAGTPGISDPGSRLVAAVLDAGHPVSTVPGPVAAVAALVASGFATDRFVFEGFLPRKGQERAQRLAEIAGERRTLVLYESPKRIGATLGHLVDAAGAERRAVVAREITKLHEEFVRGPLGELAQRYTEIPKGEIVLVIEGAAAAPEATDDELVEIVSSLVSEGVSTRDAAAQVADERGVSRRRVYQLALGIPGAVTPPS